MVLFYIQPHSTKALINQKCCHTGENLGSAVYDRLDMGQGRMGIQAPNHYDNDPTINNVLVHGFEGANEKTWRDEKGSTVLWLRGLIPESQAGSGRIMTSGYDASILWKNWNKPKLPNSDIGDNKRPMDHAPKTLGRRFDENRNPVPLHDIDKDSQVITYCWGRQETSAVPNSVIATMVICKDVSYTGQDEVLQDSSQVSLEQVIDHSSPNRASCSKHRELVDFARYLRLHTAMKSFITLAVVLGCPTIVSAAAIPKNCNLCSNSISTFPYPAFMSMEG